MSRRGSGGTTTSRLSPSTRTQPRRLPELIHSFHFSTIEAFVSSNPRLPIPGVAYTVPGSRPSTAVGHPCRAALVWSFHRASHASTNRIPIPEHVSCSRGPLGLSGPEAAAGPAGREERRGALADAAVSRATGEIAFNMPSTESGTPSSGWGRTPDTHRDLLVRTRNRSQFPSFPSSRSAQPSPDRRVGAAWRPSPRPCSTTTSSAQ